MAWQGYDRVMPMLVPGVDTAYDACYYKLEYARKNLNILDEAYVYCCCDDDMLGDTKALGDCTEDVIFITTHRGYREPTEYATGGKGWELPTFAAPGKQGSYPLNCDIGCSIVRGFVWKAIGWDQSRHDADGLHALSLAVSYYSKAYKPEVLLLWNYLQPGRWSPPSTDGTEAYVPMVRFRGNGVFHEWENKGRMVLQDSWEIFGAPPDQEPERSNDFYPEVIGIPHQIAGGTDGHNH